ncbi:putative cadherin domain-containing protein [Synechococcus sp. RS9907]|uniref:SwmB domain-containing protein n=1 Tax=Synechococcus sp. RS9907 TaxID=221350 RepID=UPI00165D6674|nr:SwmB domain-containing protein [Synechococcus sp. RS9907]QNI83697.1 putative cadherin domain-containing protein [Synechococcus sp. RS9907]
MTAPVFQSAATSADGSTLTLSYDQALSSTTAATSDFAVTTAGSANVVTAVSTSGSDVELTLTTPVFKDQSVSVAYTDPSTGTNDANAVQDSAGNDAASLSATAVTNNSTYVEGLQVELFSGINFDGLIQRQQEETIYFDDSYITDAGGNHETWSTRSYGQIQAYTTGTNTWETRSDDRIRIWINGEAAQNWSTDHSSNFANNGYGWGDVVANNLVAGQWYDIKIEFAENTQVSRLKLAHKSDRSFVDELRFNTKAPIFQSAATSTDGSKVVLTYDEDLSYEEASDWVDAPNTGTSSTIAPSSSFAVTADGTANAVTAVAVSGSTVELTLTNTITSDQTVLVSYSDPNLGSSLNNNDVNAIQGIQGNDAASITNKAVTNNSSVIANGVTIAQTGTDDGAGNLLTTEAGSTTTFTVVLDAQPTDTVTVSISGLDTSENSLDTDTLTFTTANWNTPQTVTVTGVNDDVDDGDITTTLTATASNTGGYAGTETDTTTVKNTDDDTNGITIAQTGSTSGSDLLTTEAGSSSTFTVVLDAQPTDTVTVSISGLDTSENSLSSDTLSFTTANWNTPQTVTVTGVDDTLLDGDITTTLTATASNTGGYAGTESTTTTVKNTDDDTRRRHQRHHHCPDRFHLRIRSPHHRSWILLHIHCRPRRTTHRHRHRLHLRARYI